MRLGRRRLGSGVEFCGKEIRIREEAWKMEIRIRRGGL
jgi:hypothetical protein